MNMPNSPRMYRPIERLGLVGEPRRELFALSRPFADVFLSLELKPIAPKLGVQSNGQDSN